ncbi:MAG: hypothetical protein ABSF69_26065 [Polyangiaceae bacterium]|jgi:hypothetical protein
MMALGSTFLPIFKKFPPGTMSSWYDRSSGSVMAFSCEVLTRE